MLLVWETSGVLGNRLSITQTGLDLHARQIKGECRENVFPSDRLWRVPVVGFRYVGTLCDDWRGLWNNIRATAGVFAGKVCRIDILRCPLCLRFAPVYVSSVGLAESKTPQELNWKFKFSLFVLKGDKIENDTAAFLFDGGWSISHFLFDILRAGWRCAVNLCLFRWFDLNQTGLYSN